MTIQVCIAPGSIIAMFDQQTNQSTTRLMTVQVLQTEQDKSLSSDQIDHHTYDAVRPTCKRSGLICFEVVVVARAGSSLWSLLLWSHLQEDRPA